jgi:hypothetical protein
MRESDIDTIRRGERMKCVDELRAMAKVADRTPYGVTYEGGIDAKDVSRIMEAAAREIERAFVIEQEPEEPDMARIMRLGAPD